MTEESLMIDSTDFTFALHPCTTAYDAQSTLYWRSQRDSPLVLASRSVLNGTGSASEHTGRLS